MKVRLFFFALLSVVMSAAARAQAPVAPTAPAVPSTVAAPGASTTALTQPPAAPSASEDKEAAPSAAPAEAPRPVTPPSVVAPTADQFARLCANTHDPADCGKKIEASQFAKQPSGIGSVVKRDGSLLAVMVPGEPPFLFEDKPGEAGPNYSFYGYYAPSDSVVLYRAQADKLDFVLVHRETKSTTELPNEPFFNSDGRYFATIDFCKEGCENRLAVWRFERRGPARERVFAPRNPWTDASVGWGAPRRLIVDYTENGRNGSMNLDVGDARWTVLLP